MKINPSLTFRDYKYIYALTFDALKDEKVGQGDGKGNINFHTFFGLLDLVNSKMSAMGERIRGEECDVFREVFWDLFRQGFISIGNLESQSRGIDYEIRGSALEHLTFPYFRLTKKYYDVAAKDFKKKSIIYKIQSIPYVVWSKLRLFLGWIFKNLGVLLSILKWIK